MANERILVVEDEPSVATLIRRLLQTGGYQVAAAVGSGEEALVEAARLQPDLALMDINLMGPLDGVQTAQRLQSRFDIPVVFLTGLADDATVQRSHEAKAFGYILKPFRQEDLKTSIDLALSKHKVESKLRRIERWFTAAIKSVGDAVITTDEDAVITFLNPVAEALTGWQFDQAQGRKLEEVFRIAPSLTGAAVASPVKRPPHERAILDFPRQTTIVGTDGTSVPIECSAAPIRNDGAIIGTVLVFRDITERKQAEEDLKQSREQLRSLAAHLQGIREEERSRISREIHDELGQMLTGLKMDVAWLDKRINALPDAEARTPLSGKVQSMLGLLDHMVKTVRKISADLRPGVLDDLGLVPAIEWQAREWQARTGIECSFTTALGEAGGLDVPPELGTALFRIFQETLTNVARHAQATRVSVHLRAEGEALRMELHDNGRGISENEMRHTKSLGLVGMRERAAMLGGDFRITGAPGRGTTVNVRIPIKKPSAAPASAPSQSY
jgi:two-component system sensor histidine kinase UhpB